MTSEEERKDITPEQPEEGLPEEASVEVVLEREAGSGSGEATEEPPLVDLEEPAALPAGDAGRAASEVSNDDRLMAALAWFSMVILQLPLVSVVLLLAEGNKDRPFQRYHAITSTLFWVAALVYEGLAVIAFTVLTIISLGCLAVCLWVIFFLPHLVALYYAFQAYNGKQTEIPIISDFARKQGWV